MTNAVVDRLWELLAQDEARAERSRAARLGQFLRDTDLSWAWAPLRRLLWAALGLVLLALAMAAAALVPNGRIGAGAQAMEPVPGGVRVVMCGIGGAPADWVVPAR